MHFGKVFLFLSCRLSHTINQYDPKGHRWAKHISYQIVLASYIRHSVRILHCMFIPYVAIKPYYNRPYIAYLKLLVLQQSYIKRWIIKPNPKKERQFYNDSKTVILNAGIFDDLVSFNFIFCGLQIFEYESSWKLFNGKSWRAQFKWHGRGQWCP